MSEQQQQESSELPVVERNDITLVGEHTQEEMAYLTGLIRSAIPPATGKPTKAKFRPMEFPTEELLEDIQRDSADNQQREEAQVLNPPKPNELAMQVAVLEAKVREAVQDYVETCGQFKVKAVEVPKS